MHPAFESLLTQTVQFKPLLGPTLNGPAGYGATTAAVRCRLSTPTRASRMVSSPGTERIDSPVIVYLHPDDFDPVTIPVGSLCSTPDGGFEPIRRIDAARSEDGPVDHYKLTVGAG